MDPSFEAMCHLGGTGGASSVANHARIDLGMLTFDERSRVIARVLPLD